MRKDPDVNNGKSPNPISVKTQRCTITVQSKQNRCIFYASITQSVIAVKLMSIAIVQLVNKPSLKKNHKNMEAIFVLMLKSLKLSQHCNNTLYLCLTGITVL